MRRSAGIFILFLFSLICFSASEYKTTKEPGIKLGKSIITQNNFLIEHAFKASVINYKAEIEKLDNYSGDISGEMLQALYSSYLLLTIKSETTKYEILKIHYISTQEALVSVKISVPDISLLILNDDFNDFIDKKLNKKLGILYSTDIEKFSDQEINELYSSTFITISEAVLEYAPKIKEYKSQNVDIKAKKINDIWILENSIYDYTEF